MWLEHWMMKLLSFNDLEGEGGGLKEEISKYCTDCTRLVTESHKIIKHQIYINAMFMFSSCCNWLNYVNIKGSKYLTEQQFLQS